MIKQTKNLLRHFLDQFLAIVLIGYAIASMCNSPKSAAATFRRIGDLPGRNFCSNVRGISPDGIHVFGTSPSELNPGEPNSPGQLGEAFTWNSEEEIHGLGQPPGAVPPDGRFIGISKSSSRDGRLVVGTNLFESAFGDIVSSEAFLWSSDEGFMDLGPLPQGFVTSTVLLT